MIMKKEWQAIQGSNLYFRHQPLCYRYTIDLFFKTPFSVPRSYFSAARSSYRGEIDRYFFLLRSLAPQEIYEGHPEGVLIELPFAVLCKNVKERFSTASRMSMSRCFFLCSYNERANRQVIARKNHGIPKLVQFAEGCRYFCEAIPEGTPVLAKKLSVTLQRKKTDNGSSASSRKA